MKKPQTTKAPCRKCLNETRHTVLKHHVTRGSAVVDSVGEISWQDTYEMLECCGCENVVLRHSHWFSENGDDEIAFYPPPISRPMPPWKNKLSRDLRSLLDEIYTALHADSRRLALMGARTAVDILLLDKVGDVGSFSQKLEQMEKVGNIARHNREYLIAALDAGSAAAHRGYQPKDQHLAQVMDIVENLLQAVYVLGEAAKELKKTTPGRHQKPRSP